MTNVEDIHENLMNGPGGVDTPVLAIYENSNVSDVNPLEVNDLNPNPIVLTDSSGSGGSSVENGDGPLSVSTKESTDDSSNEDG